MDWWMILLAAAGAYLIGSVSFTRIMLPKLAPGADVESIEETVPGMEERFTSSSTGATAVMHQVSPKWGGITALLDILKALLPTLVIRLLFPHQYLYLIAALFLIVGHNYPLYYGFKGGRGLSAMMGGFLVFDWFGTLITMMSGILVGILSGQVVLIRWSGILLMILWAALFHKGWQPVGYVLFANALFWFAMRGELKRFLILKRENKLPDEKIVADFMGMGSMYLLIERYSIPALFRRLKR